jgi:PAS domain S-box-containing protein
LAGSKRRGEDRGSASGGDVAPGRVIQELNLRRREAEQARAALAAALARLAESEERFRVLAEWTRDVIIRCDPGGVIEYASPAAQGWGYAPHELIGRNVAEFCHPDERARLLQDRDTVARGEGFAAPRLPLRVRTADGDWRWAEGSPSPLKDKAGRPLGVVTVLRDVTARRAMEDELARRRVEAEAANQAKSNFLATMSHEIRTPLNGVLGMVEAMAADALTTPQRERLEVIRASGAQLLSLLNDILDISKIEAGKLVLESVDFDAAQLCASVVAAFAGLAEAKGVALALDVAQGAHGRYLGDPTRVRQIVGNLVSNALKFTDHGRVGVRLEPAASGLRIIVSDTGVGIASRQLKRLFQKFEQEDSSTTRRFGGTGLGLAICRELTERMGGDISAKSQVGKGAVFTVDLPLASVGDAPPAARERGMRTAPMTDGSLRLLVAEDNEINRLVIQTLLEQAGLSPTLVSDGAAAIAAWDAQPFDLILMDVQMPVMDGPGATRAIRRREAETGRARTPIIALTANALAHQIGDYEAAGMDGHVAKPIELPRLFAAIAAALEADSAPRQSARRMRRLQ